MTNQERLEQLKEQQKQAEVNFHQIAGAIAIVEQQIAEENEAKEENPKKEEKKK